MVYASHGMALQGTPLARLVEAIPRDGGTSDVSVYAGDLQDVLASVGLPITPDLSDKPVGEKHRIAAELLRSICQQALRPPQPEPEPAPKPQESTPEAQVPEPPKPVSPPPPAKEQHRRRGNK